MTVSDELGNTWKDVIVLHLKTLTRHLYGGTEKNQGTPDANLPLAQNRIQRLSNMKQNY